MDKELQVRPSGYVSQYAKKEERPVDPRQVKKQAYQYSTLDIYRPTGAKKDAYSVNMYRAWANMARISFDVLICEKTNDYVKVSGKAWVGNKGDAHYMERSATVILIYKDLLRDAILSAITNGVSYSYFDSDQRRNVKRYINVPIAWEMDESGFPQITNQEAMMAILKEHIKKRNISERIARANVEKIVFSEILNDEDPSEPESSEGGSDQEGQEETNQEDNGENGGEDSQSSGQSTLSKEGQLNTLLDRIIDRAKTSAGGDSSAAKELFWSTCERVVGKRISTSDITSIEMANAILAAIPTHIIEKEEKITKADVRDVFGSDGEDHGVDKTQLTNKSSPSELELKLDEIRRELQHIFESPDNEFDNIDEAKGYILGKAGFLELKDIKTITNAESVLQVIIDYHLTVK